ncbi:nucleotide-binding protein [Aquincola sp. S2]|uniref:Nucleotide-binding protein n=1 Tax=Pseudaquabacterium terrae TaxID=2732868 RepID=A0ABX2EUC6_9BURK|nr:nucleotide-binding protein [Aquabacterium terrae]
MEKFEAHAPDVDFAIVLLSPDDVGHRAGHEDEVRPRARQNVILELGYFIGALGRKKVCVLHKGNVELPSDYVGVLYLAFDERGAWKGELAREMKASGMTIDFNKVFA